MQQELSLSKVMVTVGQHYWTFLAGERKLAVVITCDKNSERNVNETSDALETDNSIIGIIDDVDILAGNFPVAYVTVVFIS